MSELERPLDKTGETCYNSSDRMFWIAIREALLLAVRAIEDRFDLAHSRATKRERGRRE